MFEGKTLMITGGTGSFGEAVLNRFLSTDIKEIRIFSRDEKKQDDMRHRYQNDKIKYYIGDVREKDSVKSALFNVDYLFHAAALKQVPSCEFFPIEAVKTNVLGTDNVLSACIEMGVRKVICLSSSLLEDLRGDLLFPFLVFQKEGKPFRDHEGANCKSRP